MRRIRRKRPSLRLIVSSATLDATSFLEYFTASTSPDEATIVSLEGRLFPVEVAYSLEPIPDYVTKAAEVAYDINLKARATIHLSRFIFLWLTSIQQGPGDILIFLTGREEIERCLEHMSELLVS